MTESLLWPKYGLNLVDYSGVATHLAIMVTM